MLNTQVDEILFEDGKVAGVKCGGEEAKAPLVICDPSYVDKKLDKIKSIGKVIRAICIMDHPIPNTNNASSIQIILPQRQLSRNSDIYISMVSSAHAVCAKGLYIAIVSATVETADPEGEIKPAIDLLGGVLEMFVKISDLYDSTNNPAEDNLYITSSYDATSHFETASADVLQLYERIVGEKLDLNISPSEDDDDY